MRELLTRYLTRVNVKPDEDLLRYARELDRHYIPSRYPNAHPSGAPHEAYDEETSERALNAAERVIAFVRGIIGV